MRICLVYDCLFPHTVGGAERWYRFLAERLAAEGHEVSYLTLRQWRRGSDPGVVGVDVRVVGPRMKLYTRSGRRRILPPLGFGAGVLWHLLRHGSDYDVVHTCAFPYFSLLAAAAARLRWRYGIVVDWFEVWSRTYWREYLGRAAGEIGWLVQRICARVPQRAFCFSRLYAARLRREGLSGEITMLAGAYSGPIKALPRRDPEHLIVFAGRHIPEKHVPAILPALLRAREQIPDLRAAILGDGPERDIVSRLAVELALDHAVELPGFVATEIVDDHIARAMCMLLPSSREGYGLVVIEAAARGTPSVVVAGADNAAAELIVDGENGFVAASASPDDLAAAILRVRVGGPELRETTRAWFDRNAADLSLDRSLEIALRAYRSASGLSSTDPT